jgi:Ca2+-binding EF-hand superfamily protein
MLRGIGTALLMLALAGCNGEKTKEKQARADAKAAGFVPPSVTSRLDYGSAMDRRFRALDRNGDEFITSDELPRKNAARLMALDRNGDGKISAIEFSEGMLARFDKMDLNHDGTVTSEEITASKGQ